MERENLIKKLDELKSTIKDCQNHHCKNESDIGFNVKLHCIDNGTIIDDFKEKYKDDEEILKKIDRVEKKIFSVYGLWDSFIMEQWGFAEQIFVDQCRVYPSNYFEQRWNLTNGKTGFPELKSLEMAKQWDKNNKRESKAFNKIVKIWSEGRSGGYMMFEYSYDIEPSKIDDMLEDLNGGMTLEEYNENYAWDIEQIQDEIDCLDYIKQEVKTLKDGVNDSWHDELKERLQENINEILNTREEEEKARVESTEILQKKFQEYNVSSNDIKEIYECCIRHHENKGEVDKIITAS